MPWRRSRKNGKRRTKRIASQIWAETGPDPGNTAKDILKALRKMAKVMPSDSKKQYAQCLSALGEMIAAQEQETKSAIEDMGEMRDYEKNLATLGIAVSFMARHVTEPLEENMKIVADAEEMGKRINAEGGTMPKSDQEKSANMFQNMKENQSRMLHFMKFVGVLSHHIAQSQNRPYRKAQVDVLDCWNTVLDGFADRQKELGIKVEYDWSNKHDKKAKPKLVVSIDRIDLECVLTNLYLNSIESLSKTGGRRGKVTLHYWHHNNSLHIDFSDNGRGIPKDKMAEIFEPFKTGHQTDRGEMHGHGLGLYIVKKIMENYNGTAESVPAKHGATIRLVFGDIKKVAI